MGIIEHRSKSDLYKASSPFSELRCLPKDAWYQMKERERKRDSSSFSKRNFYCGIDRFSREIQQAVRTGKRNTRINDYELSSAVMEGRMMLQTEYLWVLILECCHDISDHAESQILRSLTNNMDQCDYWAHFLIKYIQLK